MVVGIFSGCPQAYSQLCLGFVTAEPSEGTGFRGGDNFMIANDATIPSSMGGEFSLAQILASGAKDCNLNYNGGGIWPNGANGCHNNENIKVTFFDASPPPFPHLPPSSPPPPPLPPSPPSPHPPAGTYMASHEVETHEEAARHCKRYGKTLAIIRTEQQVHDALSVMPASMTTYDGWKRAWVDGHYLQAPQTWPYRFGYKFVDTQMTQPEAAANCQAMGGRLVRIQTQEQAEAIYSILLLHAQPARAGIKIVWVDGRRGSDTGLGGVDDWFYADGTAASFFHWSPNQPDNWQDVEGCIEILDYSDDHMRARMNDGPCDNVQSSICENVPNTEPHVYKITPEQTSYVRVNHQFKTTLPQSSYTVSAWVYQSYDVEYASDNEFITFDIYSHQPWPDGFKGKPHLQMDSSLGVRGQWHKFSTQYTDVNNLDDALQSTTYFFQNATLVRGYVLITGLSVVSNTDGKEYVVDGHFPGGVMPGVWSGQNLCDTPGSYGCVTQKLGWMHSDGSVATWRWRPGNPAQEDENTCILLGKHTYPEHANEYGAMTISCNQTY